MRSAKILGWVVGAIIALIVVILVSVKMLVDPNRYKDRISAAVKQSTGRELKLAGDIKLSVFPWIALELGNATLGNPPGFPDEPFLAFQKAAVRVKLMPLLHHELEIDKVELDGLDLRLHKNAKGEGNWNMGKDEPESTPAKQGGTSTELKSIAGIKVTNGRVSYDQVITIQNFNFETGTIAAGKAVPVTVSFEADRPQAHQQITFTGKLSVSGDTDAKRYSLAAVNLSGTLAQAGAGQPLHYEVSIPSLIADLKAQTLAAPEFALNAAGAKLTGKLSGTQISDDLHLTGSLALAPLVLREFAPRLGVELPKTKDPKALSSLGAGFDFAYDAKGAALDKLAVQLDDTQLKGSLKYAGDKTTTVKFDLTADKIDLDRYRPPEGSTPPPKTAAADKPKPKADPKSEPLILQGTFTLGSAHVAGLDVTNLRATLDSKDDVSHLYPTEAQIYGGKYTGDITYDSRKATPSMNLDIHLAGIDAAKLLENTKAKGRISGKANVNLKAAAQGAGADDIMKTVDGHFDANLADGAIEGVDIGYELALAQALLAKQPGTSVADNHKTKFDAFKMSAEIKDGIAVTKDLSIVSNVLKVTGQGTVNLPTSGIDMTLLASVFKNGGNTTAADIPLKISGKYTDPTVKPDLEGVAKGVLKNKLQDVLQKNGLKDLFK
jgi:AsmA protein